MFEDLSRNKNMKKDEYIDKKKSLIATTDFPSLIKYMGSKTKIIDYVIKGINDVYQGSSVVDLFAGSGTLSGALRGQVPIISNDIQSYSEILSGAYLSNISMSEKNLEDVLISVVKEAEEHSYYLKSLTVEYSVDFSTVEQLKDFKKFEELQRKLIDFDFPNETQYYLFTKNYSGTYWSLEQCTLIDGYRKVAEKYKDSDLYFLIMASMMFAMSYNSQSTGHYAQYRVAENEKSMKDILIYRNKNITSLFTRKYNDIISFYRKIENTKDRIFYSLDFEDCLKRIPRKSTVYADPPYAFVHYSRFYHALETVVRYDYPELKHKGRYRIDRHQSPFSIKTQAPEAFRRMFNLIREKESNMVLSYSDNGLISLDEIVRMANLEFGSKYTIDLRVLDYKHSSMGRKGNKDKDVREALISVKLI